MTDNDKNNKQAESPTVEIISEDGEINAISDEKIDELWEQA